MEATLSVVPAGCIAVRHIHYIDSIGEHVYDYDTCRSGGHYRPSPNMVILNPGQEEVVKRGHLMPPRKYLVRNERGRAKVRRIHEENELGMRLAFWLSVTVSVSWSILRRFR